MAWTRPDDRFDLNSVAPVWVTGSAGFIGTATTAVLAASGIDVVGIGHGIYRQSAKVTDSPPPQMVGAVDGEISTSNLDQLLRRFGYPSGIVHLAGGSSVGRSLEDPFNDFSRTVDSTAVLAEWVRSNAPLVPIVYASSAAVYGSSHRGPIVENDVVSPVSPYGFSKSMAEAVLRNYSSNFGLRTRVVRFFSVYGAGLRKQLLWDACHKLRSQGGDVAFGGTGHESRDWLHVSDAARLILSCLTMDGLPDSFVVNGGTGRATSVASVLDLLASGLSASGTVRFSQSPRAGDPDYLVSNVHKLKTQLAFRPNVAVEDGLAEYARWFLNI